MDKNRAMRIGKLWLVDGSGHGHETWECGLFLQKYDQFVLYGLGYF